MRVCNNFFSPCIGTSFRAVTLTGSDLDFNVVITFDDEVDVSSCVFELTFVDDMLSLLDGCC